MTGPQTPPAAPPNAVSAAGGPLVVGIDPSLTATGIAYSGGELTTVVYGKNCTGDHRLLRIHQMVTEALYHLNNLVTLAVLEDLPTHAHGAGKTGMVQGVVRLALVALGVPYIVVPPATVKTFATGKGNATKADMRMELYRRTGRDLRDDNQVDAFWLRAMGLQFLGHSLLDLPQSHLRAMDKVEWPDTPGAVTVHRAVTGCAVITVRRAVTG